MMAVTCAYCDSPAELVGGNAIYPHRSDLAWLKFWLCVPCKAYVGCHKGTLRPLGRLANEELRQAKQDAHAAFDPIWKFREFGKQPMKRKEAYAWLADQLNISREQCHIGEFDLDTCQRIVTICSMVRP